METLTHQAHRYKLTVTVQNKVGVLARISVLLRKFNVNIRSLDASPIDPSEKFHDIHLVIDSAKDSQKIILVMKKLERLIPVVKVLYEEISR